MFRYLYSLLRQNDVLVFVLNFHILRKKKETININHKTETKIDNHMIDSLENHTVKKKIQKHSFMFMWYDIKIRFTKKFIIFCSL